MAVSKFSTQLNEAFGNGIIVNGRISKGDLSDFLMFLKDKYVSTGDPKCYRVANHIGYMGYGYWFLSNEVCILKCI